MFLVLNKILLFHFILLNSPSTCHHHHAFKCCTISVHVCFHHAVLLHHIFFLFITIASVRFAKFIRLVLLQMLWDSVWVKRVVENYDADDQEEDYNSDYYSKEYITISNQFSKPHCIMMHICKNCQSTSLQILVSFPIYVYLRMDLKIAGIK